MLLNIKKVALSDFYNSISSNVSDVFARSGEKVDLINDRKSPIADPEIEEYLAKKPLNLVATTNWQEAYKTAEGWSDYADMIEPYNFEYRMQSIRDYGWSNTLLFDLLHNKYYKL